MSDTSIIFPSGIHHITMIADDVQQNVDFYAGVLGMRLVKRTVNFDDPNTYHRYYGDESGGRGTLLTFFPWPGARCGREGAADDAVRPCRPRSVRHRWRARCSRRLREQGRRTRHGYHSSCCLARA